MLSPQRTENPQRDPASRPLRTRKAPLYRSSHRLTSPAPGPDASLSRAFGSTRHGSLALRDGGGTLANIPERFAQKPEQGGDIQGLDHHRVDPPGARVVPLG